MKILFIVNDPPYGTERCFNAFRLALSLLKDEEKPEISVFLMADAVVCAKAGLKTPDGYYSLERMIRCAEAPSIGPLETQGENVAKTKSKAPTAGAIRTSCESTEPRS